MHTIDSDRPNLGKDSKDRIQRFGLNAIASIIFCDNVMGAMPPSPKDYISNGYILDLTSQFDNFTNFFISPSADRVRETWLFSGYKEFAGWIPLFMQIRIAAAIGGQFGSGTDAGIEGPQPHFMWF